MVRKVAMDADPAVAHRVEAAQRIPDGWQRLAIDAQVAGAAKRERGSPQVDTHLLPRQPAQFAVLRHRGAQRSECLGARSADAIRRRQHGIFAGDRRHLRGLKPGDAEELGHLSTRRASTATTPSALMISGLISASLTSGTWARRDMAATARASAGTSPR